MDSTLLIALYGAIVSTFALGWSVYRDSKNRGNLRLRCYIAEVCFSKSLNQRSAPVLAFEVVNVGVKPVQLVQIGLSLRNGRQCIVGTKVTLPKSMAPQERLIEYAVDIEILDENLKSLWVKDSVGRNYTLPRRDLRRLLSGSRVPSTIVVEQV